MGDKISACYTFTEERDDMQTGGSKGSFPDEQLQQKLVSSAHSSFSTLILVITHNNRRFLTSPCESFKAENTTFG